MPSRRQWRGFTSSSPPDLAGALRAVAERTSRRLSLSIVFVRPSRQPPGTKADQIGDGARDRARYNPHGCGWVLAVSRT